MIFSSQRSAKDAHCHHQQKGGEWVTTSISHKLYLHQPVCIHMWCCCAVRLFLIICWTYLSQFGRENDAKRVRRNMFHVMEVAVGHWCSCLGCSHAVLSIKVHTHTHTHTHIHTPTYTHNNNYITQTGYLGKAVLIELAGSHCASTFFKVITILPIIGE